MAFAKNVVSGFVEDRWIVHTADFEEDSRLGRLDWEGKAQWNSTRSNSVADFYTIGYSGRSDSDLVRRLTAYGVATLVDVRYAPVSRHRPEFSKGNLARKVFEADMQYLHRPDLGIPKDIRASASLCEMWEWYDRFVVPTFVGRNLDVFFNFAAHPVVFMCMEVDPQACHRHRLALALESKGLKSYDL